ncbi:hypothetical protein T11_2860 [Trichinella zimbabwensis]|uniref:Uncharacterized protein n=1 Tax=Trichinella zimbabwensis TaxID=268475 RepID=A0A0V1HRI9_9BILA|nr:hypothetical protein T11_2860 [Trichinella zimbabwensis]
MIIIRTIMFRTDPTLSLVGDRRRIRFHDYFVSIGRTNESRFLHFAVPNTNPNQEGQGLCCRRTSGKQAARFIHPSKLHFNQQQQQQQQQHYRSMMAHICTNEMKLFILSTLQILQKLNVMLNRCPDFVCCRLRHCCLDPSSSEHLMTEQTNQAVVGQVSLSHVVLLYKKLSRKVMFNYYKLGRKSSQPNTSMLDYITLSQTVADLV